MAGIGHHYLCSIVDGSHEAQSVIPSVSENHRTREWLTENKFHMPESLFLKPCARCEQLNPLTVRIERLSLNTDCNYTRRYLRVTNCLDDCACCTLLLARPFFTCLRFRKTAARIDPSSPRNLW